MLQVPADKAQLPADGHTPLLRAYLLFPGCFEILLAGFLAVGPRFPVLAYQRSVQYVDRLFQLLPAFVEQSTG